MPLMIVCTAKFTKKESAALDEIAATLHKSREEVVREAVRLFSAKCVPTQGAATAKEK